MAIFRVSTQLSINNSYALTIKNDILRYLGFCFYILVTHKGFVIFPIKFVKHKILKLNTVTSLYTSLSFMFIITIRIRAIIHSRVHSWILAFEYEKIGWNLTSQETNVQFWLNSSLNKNLLASKAYMVYLEVGAKIYDLRERFDVTQKCEN